MHEQAGAAISDYLERLRQELAGSDPALAQDALYDAEEHLRAELTADGAAGGDDPDRVRRAIDRYGTPGDVAEAYRLTEVRVARALAPPRPPVSPTLGGRLFGVIADPRAWGALLYMFLSLVTGILYFTWAVTGISLSLGLSLLIFGIPFCLLFLASVRAISLMEGRLLESLTGTRMPRRPVFAGGGSLFARIKAQVTDPRTWSTLLYMVLKLPLGILTFTVFIILLALSLGLLLTPFAQVIFDLPMIQAGDFTYYLSPWAFPLVWLAAALDFLVMLHLARAAGRLHGAMAKAMLVRGRA